MEYERIRSYEYLSMNVHALNTTLFASKCALFKVD